MAPKVVFSTSKSLGKPRILTGDTMVSVNFWASSTNNLMEIYWEFILWITMDRKKTGKHGIERLEAWFDPKKGTSI